MPKHLTGMMFSQLTVTLDKIAEPLVWSSQGNQYVEPTIFEICTAMLLTFAFTLPHSHSDSCSLGLSNPI